jgi:hypothetical protein
MGGRKVCFIDANGQVGTCVRDDENCLHCNFQYSHFEWLKDVKTEDDISAKVFMKTQEDYHMKLCKQVHVLEQTVYGMRDLASALRRTGFERISDELDWRAGNIEEVIERVDQLILASLKQEHANLDCENVQLKQILKIMNE